MDVQVQSVNLDHVAGVTDSGTGAIENMFRERARFTRSWLVLAPEISFSRVSYPR
jgi:hypothetical protein